MTNVNPINVNTQGIGGAFGFGSKPKSETEEQKKEAEVAVVSNEQKTLSADEILTYMAKSAAVSAPKAPKVIDPSKYVDEASAKRIAGFIAGFEDVVAANLAAITKEFPEMSEGAKQSLALSQADKQSV